MSQVKQIEEMRKEVVRIHRFFLEDDDYESLDEYSDTSVSHRSYSICTMEQRHHHSYMAILGDNI